MIAIVQATSATHTGSAPPFMLPPHRAAPSALEHRGAKS
jgi:hypothetical protein